MEHTGLILEGGGMRGVYTAGVLDLLLDEGIHVPNVYGVSAGACHGVSYVSRQRGRAIDTVLTYVGDKRYGSFHSLVTTGDYFGADFVYRQIPDELIPFDGAAYDASTSTLWAVVFNCDSGEAEYIHATDMAIHIDYIRASASLPMFSRIVEINGKHYLDGGIADSIPLAKSIADGNEKNIVVLTQHKGFVKKPTSTLPLIKTFYRKYPALAKTLEGRHLRYNGQLGLVNGEEEAGRAIVIQPSTPVTTGKLEKDKAKLRALYEQGYEDAKAKIPEIKGTN